MKHEYGVLLRWQPVEAYGRARAIITRETAREKRSQRAARRVSNSALHRGPWPSFQQQDRFKQLAIPVWQPWSGSRWRAGIRSSLCSLFPWQLSVSVSLSALGWWLQ
ncbi:uncharacterized protein ARB_06353 [Trichophyton benhamiae CBS 112371]|uniref:Uncharacterized protein n=1 Tax=Arthroderma benhamiae (strain ATCC MYA-4681 / CBS 112371) TaxID=663331 RepID=D4AQ46_ARTBC|nr:uncharacterized protein ARB_06353 [Trichophyton benhamiae CBS 112371]EFE34590.1 hypothetical protein ARB_06353 [Trichophyton benhamiae CBS 112371]